METNIQRPMLKLCWTHRLHLVWPKDEGILDVSAQTEGRMEAPELHEHSPAGAVHTCECLWASHICSCVLPPDVWLCFVCSCCLLCSCAWVPRTLWCCGSSQPNNYQETPCKSAEPGMICLGCVIVFWQKKMYKNSNMPEYAKGSGAVIRTSGAWPEGWCWCGQPYAS